MRFTLFVLRDRIFQEVENGKYKFGRFSKVGH